MNVLNERSSVECYSSSTVGNEIVYCPAGVVPSSRVAESGSKRHCVRAGCNIVSLCGAHNTKENEGGGHLSRPN